MHQSLSFLLMQLLTNNSIKVNTKELIFQLEHHPSYPSLHALTGVLEHFGVDYVAMDVPQNPEVFDDLPNTFIAQVEYEQQAELALVQKIGNLIVLTFEEKRKKTVPVNVFLEQWTGVLVAVEANQKPKNTTQNVFAQTSLYGLSLAGILALFFSHSEFWFSSLHFLLSITGLFISLMIVRHELGIDGNFTDKLCTGGKVNCHEVLNSTGATILGIFKLSSVGVVYFASLSVAWLMMVLSSSYSYGLFVMLTLAAGTFTFYSIYYQTWVLKKWCSLCLGVVFVLLGQVASLTFAEGQLLKVDFTSLFILIPSCLASISLWQLIYPKLRLAKDYRIIKGKYRKFKANFQVFKAFMAEKPIKDTHIQDSLELVFGDQQNPTFVEVIFITNPLCQHCKKVHKLVEELIQAKHKFLKLHVRFLVNVDQPQQEDVQLASSLLALYHHEKEEVVLQAFHDVYEDEMKPSLWKKVWQRSDASVYLAELQKEQEWCYRHDINFTPEILINGRAFPYEYDQEDLLIFVEEMIEEAKHHMQYDIDYN